MKRTLTIVIDAGATLPQRTHHSELFNRRLVACANEAFGFNLDIMRWSRGLLRVEPSKTI